MKRFKKILWVIAILFFIIQFFRIEKNNSSAESVNHISKKFIVTDEVQNILKTSCNDCHSNNTRYPWYTNVQPVAWWLQHHVNNGKEELNLDEFADYSLRRQFRKFEEIKKQIEENEMPLSSYTLVHRDAILTDHQKQTLIKWSEQMVNEMKAKYPIDSLKRKDR